MKITTGIVLSALTFAASPTVLAAPFPASPRSPSVGHHEESPLLAAQSPRPPHNARSSLAVRMDTPDVTDNIDAMDEDESDSSDDSGDEEMDDVPAVVPSQRRRRLRRQLEGLGLGSGGNTDGLLGLNLGNLPLVGGLQQGLGLSGPLTDLGNTVGGIVNGLPVVGGIAQDTLTPIVKNLGNTLNGLLGGTAPDPASPQSASKSVNHWIQQYPQLAALSPAQLAALENSLGGDPSHAVQQAMQVPEKAAQYSQYASYGQGSAGLSQLLGSDGGLLSQLGALGGISTQLSGVTNALPASLQNLPLSTLSSLTPQMQPALGNAISGISSALPSQLHALPISTLSQLGGLNTNQLGSLLNMLQVKAVQPPTSESLAVHPTSTLPLESALPTHSLAAFKAESAPYSASVDESALKALESLTLSTAPKPTTTVPAFSSTPSISIGAVATDVPIKAAKILPYSYPMPSITVTAPTDAPNPTVTLPATTGTAEEEEEEDEPVYPEAGDEDY